MGKMRGKTIYHSPYWYEKRCKDENLGSPKSKVMLINDIGDYIDKTCTDEENIHKYRERWESTEFQIENGMRIGEICLEEIKKDDKVSWNRIIKGIGDDEEYFDELVEDIARQILGGKDKLLHATILKIRKEKQKPLSIKKRTRALTINPFASSHGPLVEDNSLHTWSNPYGNQEDYYKELTNHSLVITLLECVKERMMLIVLYEIEGINKKLRRHIDRGVEVDKLLQRGIDENQLSIATMLSIGKMRDYNKALHKYIRGKKGLVDTGNASDEIIKIFGKKKRKDIKGFE